MAKYISVLPCKHRSTNKSYLHSYTSYVLCWLLICDCFLGHFNFYNVHLSHFSTRRDQIILPVSVDEVDITRPPLSIIWEEHH